MVMVGLYQARNYAKASSIPLNFYSERISYGDCVVIAFSTVICLVVMSTFSL